MLSMPKNTVIDRVSDDDIKTLISCAGFGIGYWIDDATHEREIKALRVIDAGGHAPATDLSYDTLRKALAELAEAGKLPDWQIEELRRNDLGFDAAVGDKVVQHALFGRQIYG